MLSSFLAHFITYERILMNPKKYQVCRNESVETKLDFELVSHKLSIILEADVIVCHSFFRWSDCDLLPSI
jgi:hypothetical protein